MARFVKHLTNPASDNVTAGTIQRKKTIKTKATMKINVEVVIGDREVVIEVTINEEADAEGGQHNNNTINKRDNTSTKTTKSLLETLSLIKT